MNNVSNIANNSNNHRVNPEFIKDVRLHDGTRVDQKLYESILQRIKTVIPTLKQGVNYTAKQLCGKAFWDQLHKRDQINAGKCLVDMLQKHTLPLYYVKKNGANSRQYQVK